MRKFVLFLLGLFLVSLPSSLRSENKHLSSFEARWKQYHNGLAGYRTFRLDPAKHDLISTYHRTAWSGTCVGRSGQKHGFVLMIYNDTDRGQVGYSGLYYHGSTAPAATRSWAKYYEKKAPVRQVVDWLKVDYRFRSKFNRPYNLFPIVKHRSEVGFLQITRQGGGRRTPCGYVANFRPVYKVYTRAELLKQIQTKKLKVSDADLKKIKSANRLYKWEHYSIEYRCPFAQGCLPCLNCDFRPSEKIDFYGRGRTVFDEPFRYCNVNRFYSYDKNRQQFVERMFEKELFRPVH